MKNLEFSKQRMFPFLTGAKKEQFVTLMFQDVLNEVKKAQNVNDIFIVTSDQTILSISQKYGVNVIDDNKVIGLNNVIQLGYNHLISNGYSNIAIIPGDIPLISYREIELIFSDKTDVTIVPAHDQNGTNALRIKSITQFTFQYGENSFEKHLKETISLRLSYKKRKCDGISFDIDFPHQLHHLKNFQKQSSIFLQNIGILEEIKEKIHNLI